MMLGLGRVLRTAWTGRIPFSKANQTMRTLQVEPIIGSRELISNSHTSNSILEFSQTKSFSTGSNNVPVLQQQSGAGTISSSIPPVNVLKATSLPNESLPRLPVPPLNETLSRYAKSVRPLLTDEEFETTLRIIKDFGADNGVGVKLQAFLEQRSTQHHNWLSDWWLSTAYLEYRDPVVVFSSPGLVFPLEDFKSREEQLRYAAKVVYGALQYKGSIDKNTIQPDKMGKLPLDMSQYKKVFGTNRNPGKAKDVLSYHPNSKHFVLAYKNYFFKIVPYTPKGEVAKPSEILRQIQYVVEETSGLNGIPIGLLTSENRNTWGLVCETISKDKVNSSSIKVLEEALFLISIDRTNRPLQFPKASANVPGVEDLKKSEKQTVAALQMIHGNRTNSGNRWFDKTVQFIVGSEGECGLTYEHSPAEGPPIANMMDFIVNNLGAYESMLQIQESSPRQLENIPEKLLFNIDENATNWISEAKNHLGLLIDDLDMACFTFQKYGKDFIKNCNFSPDSYIQMAIQAAFYKVHRIPGAQYESASTRMYVGGRTETIRSCSLESLEFSRTLNDTSVSSQTKYQNMKMAIESHKKYAAKAVQGHGVDRHLLGLKLAAKELGMEVPNFFKDKGYTISSHYRLSTSQVPSMNEAFMCYGPLVPDGYGCCYNPRKNEMSFAISALNSNRQTSAEKYKIALQEVLLDMQLIAAQNIQSKL